MCILSKNGQSEVGVIDDHNNFSRGIVSVSGTFYFPPISSNNKT